MNIFFLGAGFSKPAGLPLGNELWVKVLTAAKTKNVYIGKLEYVIYEYLEYYNAKTGKKTVEEEINLEEFMSYLDINRLLLLHGGDYDASEDVLKNLISYVLYVDETRITNEQFVLYENFVAKLQSNDVVFTFNYDNLLEKTLARKKIPFRYYPFRLKHDSPLENLVIDPKEEIVVYKMHGSANWFDKADYIKWKNDWLKRGYNEEPPYLVFNGRINSTPHQLLDEPFKQDNPLANIFVVLDLGEYFNAYFGNRDKLISDCPFIVAPSYHKLASLGILGEFWNGFSNAISFANRIVVIGYSLPDHDEYARQPMYWHIKNFLNYAKPLGGTKSKIKIVDFQETHNKQADFIRKYSFIDNEMMDYCLGGFNEQALEFIFNDK